MVNVFLVRPTGKFPGQTEILKRQSRFPDWVIPNGNLFTIYKFLEFRLVSYNRTIARCRHFTTTTRILQFAIFLCKLRLLSINLSGIDKFK